MVMPIDRQGGPNRPRALSRRERRLIAAVGAVAAALIVAVAVSLLVSGPGSARGCIHVVYPGPVGAESVDRCGGAARELCGSLSRTQGFSPQARGSIAAGCRRAGLAVG
jgi:hypothetical protein